MGDDHSCGIADDGKVWCWDGNQEGELGNGLPLEDQDMPVQVASDVRFVALSAGYTHTRGIDERGGLYCWGSTLAFRDLESLKEEPEPFLVAGQ